MGAVAVTAASDAKRPTPFGDSVMVSLTDQDRAQDLQKLKEAGLASPKATFTDALLGKPDSGSSENIGYGRGRIFERFSMYSLRTSYYAFEFAARDPGAPLGV